MYFINKTKSIQSLTTAMFVATSLTIPVSSLADIYKKTDKSGNVILTNIPSDNALKVSEDRLTKPNYQTATTTSYTQQVNTPTTTVTNKTNLAPLSPNPSYPSNINYALNYLEFVNARTLGSFGQKWKSGTSPIVVAHFGDSHVQLGWQMPPIRQALQSMRGNGGRGMIFPYAIAKTYSQEDYTSSFTGNWKTANSIQQPPKIGVGVSGFVAKTQDSFTSVNFSFDKAKADIGSVQAILYFRAINGNYQITISNGSVSKKVNVAQSNDIQQIAVDLPNSYRNLSISIDKQNGSDASFEFHGLNLVNLNHQGVIYHNLGVGGAAFNALIQQKFFSQQFPMLNADLVVLDWGTNDIIYKNQIADNFESTVLQTIQKVRSANPNAGIILTSAQAATYKGNDVTVSAQLSDMLRRIAQQQGTMFYDWYRIAGGNGSINQWKQVGYASKDAIHLNGKGYRVKGELFGHALAAAASQ